MMLVILPTTQEQQYLINLESYNMKFCKYCGKQLEDNESCTCQNTVLSDALENSIPTQAPSGESKINDCSVLNNLLTSFKSFWKNPDSTVSIAIQERDITLSIIYSVVFFIATLLYNVFLFSSFNISMNSFDSIPLIGGYLSGFSVFNFGKILLTSIVMSLLIGGLYVLINVVINIIICKNNAKVAFLNAFITFSLKSIPFTVLLVLCGLLSFLSLYLLLAFLVIGITYLIISLCSDISILIGSITKNTRVMLTVNLTIAICLMICLVVSCKFLIWNLNLSSVTNLLSSIF